MQCPNPSAQNRTGQNSSFCLRDFFGTGSLPDREIHEIGSTPFEKWIPTFVALGEKGLMVKPLPVSREPGRYTMKYCPQEATAMLPNHETVPVVTDRFPRDGQESNRRQQMRMPVKEFPAGQEDGGQSNRKKTTESTPPMVA
jgi:hypothetical protein